MNSMVKPSNMTRGKKEALKGLPRKHCKETFRKRAHQLQMTSEIYKNKRKAALRVLARKMQLSN
jgi:hypothetical protein